MQRTDLVNPPEARAAHSSVPKQQAQTASQAAHEEGRRGFLRPALAVVLLLLVAMPVSLFLYRGAHDGRVYRGVRALGADLGGLTRDEARASLARVAVGYPGGAVTVQGAGKSWTFTPAELGLSLDADKTLDAAFGVGRSGDFVQDVGGEVGALLSGSQVAPALRHDTALVDRAVARVAGETETAPVSSKLQRGASGKVEITPSSNGSTLDREALRASLLASLGAAPSAPVQVTMRDVAPKVTEAALRSSQAQALVLTEQPIVVRSGKQSWTLQPDDLRNMITLIPRPDGEWDAALDRQPVLDFLKPVADKVVVAPQDATVTVGKGLVTLKPDVAGVALDMDATADGILQVATSNDPAARTVTATLNSVPASITKAQAQPIYNKANALVTQGIRLRFRDDGYILRGASVTGFLDVVPNKDGEVGVAGGPFKLAIDEDVLASRISGVAYNFNRQPSDVRFRMVGGAPTKLNAGTDGLHVNVANSLDNVKKAIEGFSGSGRLQVDLDVAVTPPNMKDADIGAISTPDLLATGQTGYAGSSPERKWNVELGTRNIDGALIPPGGVFSTVDTIGDLTLAAGFKMGYAIVQSDKGLTTVPAEAGGICQVSTTLFHAVFHAGLPIVERNWHSYWIGLYGLPPSGLQGLDATISPPEKDFRFKNGTGHWLLIKATADGTNVTMRVYGVDPHWHVAIADPVITNRVKTDPAMITEQSDALPKGKTVQVEHAQDGFDASIVRTVSDAGGQVVDRWTAKSHYQPAHNRTLVGTGKAVPGVPAAPKK